MSQMTVESAMRMNAWVQAALTARHDIKHSKVYDVKGFKITQHSQQGQEIDIIKNFMPKISEVRDGTFVELGGYNGITYSNTKGIEDTFGFKGVLIEASEAFIAMNLNRPNTQNFRAAISTEPVVTFCGAGPCSGTLENMEINTLHDDILWKPNDQYTVPGRPISDILQESKLEYIDLFFIDVEGSELDVINTMDWSIPIYLICIEMHGMKSRQKEQEEIRKILKQQGFTFKKKIEDDEIWVNDSYFRKDKFV